MTWLSSQALTLYANSPLLLLCWQYDCESNDCHLLAGFVCMQNIYISNGQGVIVWC